MTDPLKKVWHTAAEAAEYVRYSLATIERAVEAGELPFAQRVHGGRRRFHVDHLDAWVRGEALPAVSGL